MSSFVIDASVAIKWYFPETHAAHADRLRQPQHLLLAPEFINVEVCNVAWKKVGRAEISRNDATLVVGAFLANPLYRHPDVTLNALSYDLACSPGRSVYDCMYLALSLRIGHPLVTADQRFFNALAATAYSAIMLWIENVP